MGGRIGKKMRNRRDRSVLVQCSTLSHPPPNQNPARTQARNKRPRSSRRNPTHLHLHAHLPSQLRDLRINHRQRLLHQLHTPRLIRRVGRHDVKRRRDESDLYRDVLGRDGLSSLEGSLDGVDSFVRETLDLDVGSDLDGLGRETTGDVLLQGGEEVGSDVDAFVHLLGLAEGVGGWEFEFGRGVEGVVGEEIGRCSSRWRVRRTRERRRRRKGREGQLLRFVSSSAKATSEERDEPDTELESIVSVTESLRQRPGDLGVEQLDVDLHLSGDVGEDRVDEFSLLELLLTLLDVLGRDSSLGQINVS